MSDVNERLPGEVWRGRDEDGDLLAVTEDGPGGYLHAWLWGDGWGEMRESGLREIAFSCWALDLRSKLAIADPCIDERDRLVRVAIECGGEHATKRTAAVMDIAEQSIRGLKAQRDALRTAVATALASLNSIGRDGETYSDNPEDHINDARRALEEAK